MNITVNPINSVDKEIILKATREDLADRFEKALKNIRKKAQIPGFRPGTAPMALIRKRFASDVEGEEINNYIQEVFRETIFPEHKPVGEPKITDMSWENDELEVVFKIGVKPEFDLVDVKSLKVDKLVHDVTEEEIDREIDYALSRRGTWSDSEDAVEENSKVKADILPLDDHGHTTSLEENQELDLSDEENAAFRKDLAGKKIGDTVEVKIEHGDHSHAYQITIKSHQKLTKAELNEAFISEATRGEATDVEGYRAFLKNNIQNYFDKTAVDLMKEDIADALVEAHDFEVPESLVEMLIQSYFEDYKKRAKGTVDDNYYAQFRESSLERGKKEAKWMFIQDRLAEQHPEIEITPEDADNYMQAEAAKYGLTVDMIKQFYASSTEQLENLRMNLRSQKLFDMLSNEIGVNELDKEAYQNRKK